jgi:dTDP-4-amino-4,6-dideoxygalactose transaminase
MIPITKPFLPPFEEYEALLKGIWERNWLTNNGPLVLELEEELKKYLGLVHLLYVTNGTIAIQLGLKALGIKGKVITTPFSYVATTSSIVWEGCTPVFADIDPETLNIDPAKIEDAISSNTEAILATHCFGNPCDIEAIEIIARKHGLKVIYDAAHGFGTKYKGKSIFEFGDVTTTSFHATKLFHTIEGGAVFFKSKELMDVVGRMRNFGHDGFDKFRGVGINGKNSEFHAAMGLVNLKYISRILEGRKIQSANYDEGLNWSKLRKIKIQPGTEYNHAYYPIIFESESELLKVKQGLEEKEIFTRRYFYPSLNTLHYIENQPTPVSEDIASRILCLPLYYDLTESQQVEICAIINAFLLK